MEAMLLVSAAMEAYQFIKQSCELYKQGKQIVTEVNQITKDVQETIGFFGRLFGKKPKQEVKTVEPAKKKIAAEFDENLLFTQVSDALIKFFQAYNALKAYKKEQEELALHVGNEEGNEIAIKLVIADLQMEKLNTDLTNYMVYMVPQELKDLYTRVNQMISHIANQQALARKAELDKKRREAWQKQQRMELIQDRIAITIVTLIMILWAWGMMLTLMHWR